MVCAWCGRRRDPHTFVRWLEPLSFETLEAKAVTHGICPTCQQAILDDIRSGILLRRFTP